MYIHIAKSAFVHIHMCVSNDSEYVYVQVHCTKCTTGGHGRIIKKKRQRGYHYINPFYLVFQKKWCQ